jgi:hypothetical protein
MHKIDVYVNKAVKNAQDLTEELVKNSLKKGINNQTIQQEFQKFVQKATTTAQEDFSKGDQNQNKKGTLQKPLLATKLTDEKPSDPVEFHFQITPVKGGDRVSF